MAKTAARTKLSNVAGILYVLVGAVYLFSALASIILGAVYGTRPVSAELPYGASGTLVGIGLTTLAWSIINFLIARALFRRSVRGARWGFTLAALYMPTSLMSPLGFFSDLNCLTIFFLLANAFIAIILWIARDDFGLPANPAPAASLEASQ